MRSALIIGAGPAGLSAARTLREGGVDDVLVIERNGVAGGLPRFCGHTGWGLLDLRRLYRGPAYAQRLVERAEGIEIATGVSVLELQPGGSVVVSGPRGIEGLSARSVLIATGIREAPRSARLISGTRPPGVMNTGAFQELVYAGGMKPFARPVIIGTELVAFSALMTARHAGIRPVAMIEEAHRITARRPGDLIARLAFGVPVLTGTRLKAIRGEDRVTGVLIEHDGAEREIACDGVILSGHFVPEAALVRASALDLDAATGGPSIDSHFRLSDPAFFAAGNVLRAVEHSGIAALEGRAAALAMLAAGAGRLPDPASAVPVETAGALAYATPQRLYTGAGEVRLNLRLKRAFRGELVASQEGRELHRQALKGLPERRIIVRLATNGLRSGVPLLIASSDKE